MSLFDKFYNSNIQLDKNVIHDILDECSKEKKKILVFGMGFDSKLWSEAGDTYFVENDKYYIQLNEFIKEDHSIYYQYKNINVKKSCEIIESNSQTDVIKYLTNNYEIPEKLVENGPYDIIIVDGPPGYSENLPGRLLSVFWSVNFLSRKNTILYIDDCNRKLESLCIQKFISPEKLNKKFLNRDVCMKFIL